MIQKRPKISDLEKDLHSSEYILNKVRTRISYAQNLYAALCNVKWCKLDTANSFEILLEQFWSCSWRQSGGIVADLRGGGDYMDWYCSGIQGGDEPDVYQDVNYADKMYVPEGEVTEELREDLRKLGWIPIFSRGA